MQIKTLKEIINEIKPDYQYFVKDFKDKKVKKTNVKIELIKLEKTLTNGEAKSFINEKGLRPATFHEMAYFIRDNPGIWKEKTAIFSIMGDYYLAFDRWRGKRDVRCHRLGYYWSDCWWFAGVRKGSLPLESLSSAPLDFGLLEISYNGKKYKLTEV